MYLATTPAQKAERILAYFRTVLDGFSPSAPGSKSQYTVEEFPYKSFSETIFSNSTVRQIRNPTK